MPKTDYDDPEIPFPRLQARIQLLDEQTYWLQVWLWEKVGGPPKQLINRKRAGTANDAHEYLKAFSEENDAWIDADDITVEKAENSN
jgi:hypothetical protein